MDFRTSAWTLRDALADASTFDEIERRPVHSMNAKAVARFTTQSDPDATPIAGEELLGAGCRYVGTTTESLPKQPGEPCDTFVDADETTYITVRRRIARTPVFMLLSRYFLTTIFSDGVLVETVARTKPVNSGPLLVPRGGTGDLLADLESHMAFVRERAARGKAIIRIGSLADVVRAKRYFISHAISADDAEAVVNAAKHSRTLTRAIFSVLAVVLAVSLYALLRAR